MATVHESTTSNGGIVTPGYYYREEVNNNKNNVSRTHYLSSSAYELSSMDEYIIDIDDDDDEQDHLTDDEDNEYYDSEYDNDDGRVYSRVAGAGTAHTSSSTVNAADCPPFPLLQVLPTTTEVRMDEPTFTRRPLIVRNGSVRAPHFTTHTTESTHESSDQLG
jgi:hypothetical protein